MKILQIAQKPQRRGAETFAFQLSEHLRRQGHSVRMAYLYSYQGVAALPLQEQDCLLGGQVRHPLERFPGFHPRLLHRLLRQIREFKPDVVQVNGSRTVKYGAFAHLLQRNATWVLIYRNIGHPRDWVRGWHYRFFYRYLVMPQIDGVVGVSRTTLQVVKEFYNLVVPMVHIPIGVDPAAMIARASRDAIRQEMGIPSGSPVVIFVGSLTPEKRLDRLFRVVRQVLVALPDLRLWVVGDGPLRFELERLARVEALAARVCFWGAQANVATYINAADLLLLTSDTEGIPGVVLEAGLLGLPVVATRVGGLPECVLDGETGVLADPQDEQKLAQAVCALLQDPARREEMGKRAQAWIGENFAMDRIVQQYMDFCRQVLQG